MPQVVLGGVTHARGLAPSTSGSMNNSAALQAFIDAQSGPSHALVRVTTAGPFDITVDDPTMLIKVSGQTDLTVRGRCVVSAGEQARVSAYGSVVVQVREGATCVLHDTCVGQGGDRGSLVVHDRGRATVTGQATVRGFDAATLSARQKATVFAHESSSVQAFDEAVVHAQGRSRVTLTGQGVTLGVADEAQVRRLG